MATFGIFSKICVGCCESLIISYVYLRGGCLSSLLDIIQVTFLVTFIRMLGNKLSLGFVKFEKPLCPTKQVDKNKSC